MRLIDAEALKEFISDMQVRGGNAYYHKGMNDALHEAFPKFIDEQPTIDPEALPIVREMREQVGNLCEFLCYATNGKLSKSNYTVGEMKVAFDDCVKLECDNCSMVSEIWELRENLAKAEELISFISDEFGRGHVHHDEIEDAISEYEDGKNG